MIRLPVVFFLMSLGICLDQTTMAQEQEIRAATIWTKVSNFKYRIIRSLKPILGSVPCEAYKNLMSPSVGISMNTWSECTKNMIDKEDDERKKEGKDCFFT